VARTPLPGRFRQDKGHLFVMSDVSFAFNIYVEINSTFF